MRRQRRKQAADPRDIEPPIAREAIENEGRGRLIVPLAPPDAHGAEEPDHHAAPIDPPHVASASRGDRRADLDSSTVRILSTVQIFEPQPPTPWLVRELQLAPGRPALLFGAAGAGKTVIAQSLALCVAAGIPAWGQFSTRAGHVLHVDYDQGEGPTRKRYRRLAAGHAIELSDLGDRLRFAPFPPVYLSSGDKAETFFRECCQGVALCVIDALRAALPNLDENDSRIGAHLAICSRVSAQTGTAFLVLHHQGKPKDGAADANTSPRGSSALLAGSGAALLVTGSKDTPKRVRIVRDSESFEGDRATDFTLRFEDLPPVADLAPLRVVYQGAAAAEGAEEKRSDLDARILAYVREHDGCGITAARSHVGGNAALATQRIEALVERGALRRVDRGRGASLHVAESGDEGDDGPDP